MYGYGIPCLLTFMVLILDEIESLPFYLRPNFDIWACSLFSEIIILYTKFVHLHISIMEIVSFSALGGWFQEILFFYLPVTIILTINTVLFVLILKRIRYVQQEVKRMEEGTLNETSSKLKEILDKKKKK